VSVIIAWTLVIWSLNVPDVLYTYQRFRYYAEFAEERCKLLL
jgi:hypothetical protein